jgi:hypothetical protein
MKKEGYVVDTFALLRLLGANHMCLWNSMVVYKKMKWDSMILISSTLAGSSIRPGERSVGSIDMGHG